jgi:putative hydrolase of the HAD superfamily
MQPGGRESTLNVVFDIGGVLLAWDPEGIAASVFASPSERELVLEGVFGHPDWVELDRGTLSHEDAAWRACDRTGLPLEHLSAMLGNVPYFLRPMPGSLELLDEVRDSGNRVFALSNLHRPSLERLRRDTDVLERFDGLTVSCEVGACKPEPAIYASLLREHALAADQTVFIDDVATNLDAAARFGIRTILFEDVDSCREQLLRVGCI